MLHTKRFRPAARRGATARRPAGGTAVLLGALGALSLVAATATASTGTASAAPSPVRWAALGDSYTSGVFVGDPSPALGSADRDGCDRTTGSYPYLVERRLAAGPPAGRQVRLTDVSCAGATIPQMTSDRQTPFSPVQPPAGGWASVAPQAERAALGPDTDVVTVGVGGNSLPFGAMLTACLLADTGQPDAAAPCRDAYEAGGTPVDPEPIDAKYERIAGEYADMLRAVHRTAPHAKVLSVGYPTVFPHDPRGCDRDDTGALAADITGVGRVSLTHGDIAWFHGVITRLDAIVRSVTESFGDTYVDTAASSAGHDVCRPRGTKWMEGICGQAGGYWPSALSFDSLTVECSGGTRVTLVHPDAAGQANIAAQVAAALRRALA
ncbi:MAG: SGNH/GDSL hydrolase family protein [Streptomyces sp.]|nr:SGNH/GDSL hydrolase family protein [Streptomyces sp.]